MNRSRGPSPDARNPSDPLRGLNPEQRQAVASTEGPLLVLAGAGSGKTKVVTARVAHLLAKGVAPESILAVTFTNKAAREMRERVAAAVGAEAARGVVLGTFHSWCVRLLRRHGKAIGIAPNFTICDAADQLSALRGALRELRVEGAALSPEAVQARISLAKNRGLDPDELARKAQSGADELVAAAWRRYGEKLDSSRGLDFDDLLRRALELLERSKPVREAVASEHRYVMVDEYQDTNGVQYEILRQIAGGHRNLCAVGDDDQSIYGWRGADVHKILKFPADFPGALVVRLETNYRSTNQILGAANRLIRHNSKRHEKTLRSALGDGPPVLALTSEDEHAEADTIAREIRGLVERREARFGEVAVLFRTGTQPRPFEAQFRARNVPYVLVGGPSYFDRKEVRDALAYWRLVHNEGDEVSFLRVVNVPPRGVGKAALEKAERAAAERGKSILDVFQEGGEGAGIPPATCAAVKAFLDLLASLRQRPPAGLVAWARGVLEGVGYRREVERIYGDELERAQRWGAIEDLLDLADRHARAHPGAGPASFLDALALTQEERGEDEATGRRDAVALMTLHSAKGLEFERVYLVGLEEGLLPHARSVAEDGIEEERRLMYVGVTRARAHLTLSSCAFRTRGPAKIEAHPSRFLFEIRGVPPPAGWQAAGARVAPGASSVHERRPPAGARRKPRLPISLGG
jgi:superfamily I DNA/RNA helicase